MNQPQFLFIIHQLLNNPIVSQEDNNIIVELIPKKVSVIHNYDDNGVNHIYFNFEDKYIELINEEDLKNIIKNEITLELAESIYKKYFFIGRTDFHI